MGARQEGSGGFSAAAAPRPPNSRHSHRRRRLHFGWGGRRRGCLFRPRHLCCAGCGCQRQRRRPGGWCAAQPSLPGPSRPAAARKTKHLRVVQRPGGLATGRLRPARHARLLGGRLPGWGRQGVGQHPSGRPHFLGRLACRAGVGAPRGGRDVLGAFGWVRPRPPHIAARKSNSGLGATANPHRRAGGAAAAFLSSLPRGGVHLAPSQSAVGCPGAGAGGACGAVAGTPRADWGLAGLERRIPGGGCGVVAGAGTESGHRDEDAHGSGCGGHAGGDAGCGATGVLAGAGTN
mmetsp:Transcript_10397/g.34429  ORF Transcript_10397/g.34429 Transcript_10397/m.34429 type:complete len:291 (-) Transcript_10397:844-1716(-)